MRRERAVDRNENGTEDRNDLISGTKGDDERDGEGM